MGDPSLLKQQEGKYLLTGLQKLRMLEIMESCVAPDRQGRTAHLLCLPRQATAASEL